MTSILNPVLVVIDMQNGFVNEHTRHVIGNVKVLLDCCSSHSIHTVFTRFINSPGSPFERLLGWDKVQCAPETEIVDELRGLVDIRIDKNYYSALTRELISLTQEHGWHTIILCGIATESCVLKTAVDAFESGLRPIVIQDACASDLGEGAHKAGLIVMENMLGTAQIMTVAQLADQLDN